MDWAKLTNGGFKPALLSDARPPPHRSGQAIGSLPQGSRPAVSAPAVVADAAALRRRDSDVETATFQ